MTAFRSTTAPAGCTADMMSRRGVQRLRACASGVLTGLLIIASSTVADAETGDPESAVIELDRQAAENFEIEDYEQALELLEAAQHLVPSAVREYNIAVCQERLGHLSEALSGYQRFVYESNIAEERRAEALERIERLRGLLDESGEIHGTEHPVAVNFSESVEPPDRRRLSPTIFYALVSVTAVSGVGLISAGAVSLHYQSEFEETEFGSTGGAAVRDQGEPWVVASNVLLGVTIACAITTLVVALFTRWRSAREARRPMRFALNP